MDTEKVRSVLQSIHIDVLGRKLESKTLTYHVNKVVNDNATFEDFESKLVNGEEYGNSIKKSFRETYIELIDFDVSDADVQTFFKGRMNPNVRVTDGEIRSYITNLSRFDEKYINLINSTYMLLKSGPCNIHTINCYLKFFKINPSYTIEDLTDSILSEIAQQTLRDAGVDADADANADAGANNADADDYLNDIRTKFGGLLPDITDLQTTGAQTAPEIKTIVLADFEKAFKRPMFVEEYFKYVMGNNYTDVIDWTQVAKAHYANYHSLLEIYEAYTKQRISEYFMVKNFLDIEGLENTSVFNKIVETITDSTEYKKSMCDVLRAKYRNIYDDDINDEDIAYIFEKVHKLRVSLVDDRLTTILAEFKRETDEIVSNIFRQFSIVVDRDPDINDIEKYSAYYRSGLTTDASDYAKINARMEEILMQSLEFHDILKKRIRSLYAEKYNKEIIPSILFNTLQKVSQAIRDYSMGNLNDGIRTLI